MPSAPIAITGIGITAPGASSPAQLWDNLEAKRSPAELWEGGRTLAVCPVTESLETPGLALPRRGHRPDRMIRLALMAASRAWNDAGLGGNPGIPPSRIAVVAGSSRGPVSKLEQAIAGTSAGARKLPPSLASDSMLGSLHGTLAYVFGTLGPAYSVSAACSSGGHAIALAADHIASGSADLAIAGASDASLAAAIINQFLSTGILDPSLPPAPVCRPYDVQARGAVLGEAAAFLILESMESARARGAFIHGHLCGWAMAADGRAASAESAGSTALVSASALALGKAGLAGDALGYINTHGTATRVSDAMEMGWIRGLDAARTFPVPFSSTKPVTGHCLGATSALEAVVCLETLRRRRIPPTTNCLEPHPHAPGGLVTMAGQALEGDHVLSVSLGFWGAACALVFSSKP